MRRIIKESRWNVTLITSAPQAQTLQKIVDAPSQDVAVRRAMQAFPGMQFIEVMATALDQQAPQQAPVEPEQQLPKQLAPLNPLQPLKIPGQTQQESVDTSRIRYPYSITLPAALSRVLKETSPVAVSQHHGQYHIVLESEATMRNFLHRLRLHRDRDATGIIVRGIRSSL